MTHKEFIGALRSARHVYVTVPCTGTPSNVQRYAADDVHYFQISKTEARRVLVDSQKDDVIAIVRESSLYIG